MNGPSNDLRMEVFERLAGLSTEDSRERGW